MRFARARRDVEALQEMLADQMRRLAFGRSDAQVDAGLAKVDGKELRVRVGDVQQAHVAERPHGVVERGAGSEVLRKNAFEREPRCGSSRKRLQKLPSPHWKTSDGGGPARPARFYLLTGDSGSVSSATRSLICASVRTFMCPKRGMLEHALYASAL